MKRKTEQKLKNNKLIVVLGMHRSGTSAITRALQVMGVGLGDRLMQPFEGNNPKGFWEDIDLNTLNIEMLSALGSDWYYLAPIEPSDVEILRKQGYFLRATELLRQKHGSTPIFGFKDPRVAKLLPFWKEVFSHCQFDVSYVMAVRHPLSVVKSLAKRDGIEAGQSYLLWLVHVITSLTSSAGDKRVFVDYDRLVQAPDHELNRLAKHLNLEIDLTELQNYKAEFLDQGLRHTVYELNDLLLDDTCLPIVREVYAALLDVASKKTKVDEVELQNKLVRWSDEFERLRSPLLLVDKLLAQKLVATQAVAERDGQIANLNQAVTGRDGQIVNLNQAVAERDEQVINLNQALAESDGQIVNLNQALAERDGQIVNLNQALAESDGQIVNLNQAAIERDEYHQLTLRHIFSSTSWRLTSPLRSIVTYWKRSLRIMKIVPSAIKHGKGIKQTAIKAVRIYQNEGMDGLRRALTSLRATNTARPIYSAQTTYEVADSKPVIPQIDFDQTCNRFVPYQKNPPINPLVKLIAFYLPQFHPFPENDEWWGKGFTEWTNVGKAQPNYFGHYQPHCPIHNGYYDLRVPEVMEEQAKLAKEYGIYGFNYYFYWFGGKVLMDTPLEQMLANKKVDIPFCLTWANENWSRRWDGQENDILIAQNHSDEDSLAFIRHLIKYFKDERYIRIDGKPVLIIYRANIIPNMAATAKIWRDELLKHGLPGLYLVSAQTFGIRSPEPFDFDASVEFPPHTIISEDITNEFDLVNTDFSGHIYSYEQVAANAVLSNEPDYKLYRTAMLSWDNTARKQNNSHIFHNFSLLRYKQWLSSIINKAHSNPKYSADEKIVFVNAWNEWAEGTHLEPDQKFGYGYLQTTYEVLRDYEPLPMTESTRLHAPIKRNDYAVILHLHYEELWPNIRDYLMRSFSDQGFDLYTSVTSSTAAKKILEDFPDAYIELVENRGRDILPFIRMLKVIKNLGYTAVCKIHSKRSVYRNDGDNIRDEIFDALMGSKEQVEEILTRFRNNARLGLVAPKNYLIEHNDHNMTFDKEVIHKLSSHIKIKFKYDIFPAGSMFWFSPKSLEPLLTIDDTFFEIESGLADGTCAHAVERMFCLITKNSNYSIESC